MFGKSYPHLHHHTIQYQLNVGKLRSYLAKLKNPKPAKSIWRGFQNYHHPLGWPISLGVKPAGLLPKPFTVFVAQKNTMFFAPLDGAQELPTAVGSIDEALGEIKSIQPGPPPVINEGMTPIRKLISSRLPIYKAFFKGYNSTYHYSRGPPCLGCAKNIPDTHRIHL